jgi:2-polyprenyl-3-methyl-5-hydroxy-6-metoxy-1,4-benzoquinol methylase
MLIVAPVRDEKHLKIPSALADAEGIDKLNQSRSVIPAVTHVDYSARIQTVDNERNGLLYKLMKKFYSKTGCPVMVNTSFNLGWEPIVGSPRDAYETFMSSDIDMLCIGKYLLSKTQQKAKVKSVIDNTSDEVFENIIASPCCKATLNKKDDTLVCSQCSHEFPITENIPQLFWPHDEISSDTDVTEVVKSFYEETPFPNYDEHDSIRSLIEKSRRGMYARRLDETIKYNTTVLEVGCGTGQLTNFLGMSCRKVIGTDMCLNSLRLGEEFRKTHGLTQVRFLQMNLFRPALFNEQYDVVLCNGVLHHTADPYGGFKGLVPLVKPGGYIIIGLYNTYGRLFTDLRRHIFRLTQGKAKWVDPILRRSGLSEGKRKAWFADQYCHPHESKHTFGEVLGWFDENDIDFVRGVPAMRTEDDGLGGEGLFEPQPAGTPFDHFLVQAIEIFAAGQKEGGFFIMIGRKRGGDEGSEKIIESRAHERMSAVESNVIS